MKKIFRVFCVSFLALSLFACSSATKVSSDITAKIVVPDALVSLYNEKSLGFKSVNNVRQLGGYVTKDGMKVKDGLLLRGGHLARINDEEMATLKDKYNLMEIVDFRVAEERDHAMDREIDGVDNNWVLVVESNSIMSKLENICEVEEVNKLATYYKYNGGIDDMYLKLVNEEISHDGYHEFFNILLSNDGATYFHCSSGKDRTGFAAVLLLSALGVDERTILDDYEISLIAKEKNMNIALEVLKEKGYAEKDIKEIVDLVGVKREAMEGALREVDKRYDGMDAYLHNQIGLTDDDIEVLRNKYLE